MFQQFSNKSIKGGCICVNRDKFMVELFPVISDKKVLNMHRCNGSEQNGITEIDIGTVPKFSTIGKFKLELKKPSTGISLLSVKEPK